jgi:phage-related protein
MPASRPLPEIGARCHELRVVDRDATWRIVYHVAEDAIVLLDVFSKKTRTLPGSVAIAAKRRLREYQRVARED